MTRFRAYAQHQAYLLPPRLDEMIESSDLARVVDRVVEGVKIAALLERYPGGGSPAYHPRMMLKVLVYAYGTRVYSSRQIAKHLRRDMNFMWLAGRNTPDFRTINRFRGEYLQEAMAPIFAEVVGLLIRLRGKKKAATEFGLLFTSLNIRKLHSLSLN